MSATATATAKQTQSKAQRIMTFVVMGVPGAFVFGISGAAVGAIIAEAEWPVLPLSVLVMLGGVVLLMIGAGFAGKPLYLIAILPLPVLTSMGCCLWSNGHRWGLPIGLIGALAPAAIYPIHRFYRKRAEMQKQLAASQSVTH